LKARGQTCEICGPDFGTNFWTHESRFRVRGAANGPIFGTVFRTQKWDPKIMPNRTLLLQMRCLKFFPHLRCCRPEDGGVWAERVLFSVPTGRRATLHSCHASRSSRGLSRNAGVTAVNARAATEAPGQCIERVRARRAWTRKCTEARGSANLLPTQRLNKASLGARRSCHRLLGPDALEAQKRTILFAVLFLGPESGPKKWAQSRQRYGRDSFSRT
jgi:hypothetical protein